MTKSSFLERFGQFAGQFRRVVLLAFLRRLIDGVKRSVTVLAFRADVRRTCKQSQWHPLLVLIFFCGLFMGLLTQGRLGDGEGKGEGAGVDLPLIVGVRRLRCHLLSC